MFLDFIPTQQISQVKKEILKDPLSLDEITVALKDKNNNKPLVSDGLPLEFHKKCKIIFLPKLLNICNNSKKRYTTSYFI